MDSENGERICDHFYPTRPWKRNYFLINLIWQTKPQTMGHKRVSNFKQVLGNKLRATETQGVGTRDPS